MNRRLAYSSEAVTPDDMAPWATRQAEEQDAYGPRRRVIREQMANEDRTLTGGYLTEEIREAIRTGIAKDAAMREACLAFGTPWALEATELPRE